MSIITDHFPAADLDLSMSAAALFCGICPGITQPHDTKQNNDAPPVTPTIGKMTAYHF